MVTSFSFGRAVVVAGVRQLVVFLVDTDPWVVLPAVGVGEHERRDIGQAADVGEQHEVHLQLADDRKVVVGAHVDLGRHRERRAAHRRPAELLLQAADAGQVRVQARLVFRGHAAS